MYFPILARISPIQAPKLPTKSLKNELPMLYIVTNKKIMKSGKKTILRTLNMLNFRLVSLLLLNELNKSRKA